MGFYILGIEAVWIFLAKRPQMGHRMGIYWLVKYVIFNLCISRVFSGSARCCFRKQCQISCFWQAVLVGQIAILVYDKAYQYVQGNPMGKMEKTYSIRECMRKSCRDDRIFLLYKGMSHISCDSRGKKVYDKVFF